MYRDGQDENRPDNDKSGQVYIRIRETLLLYRLPPQTQLNIRNIAEGMNVSPTPVRESLIRLAHEEIILMVPGRGFFTKPLSVRELESDYELALLIAKHAIEKNIHNFSIEGIFKPNGFEQGAEELTVSANMARSWTIFLEALYERIASLSANNKFIRIMRQFNDRTTLIREIDLLQSNRFCQITDDTAELVTLLIDHNAAKAIQNLERQNNAKLQLLYELVKEGNARSLGAAGLTKTSF
ncbi:MAG: hypothetical protein COB78_06945 [Hyphomicrobiales bacterium]|nr:MAG: hypothetical protein COB78_06945 [Hyphomicrobiales bacterium]